MKLVNQLLLSVLFELEPLFILLLVKFRIKSTHIFLKPLTRKNKLMQNVPKSYHVRVKPQKNFPQQVP